MDSVIKVDFSPEFFKLVFQGVKELGAVRTIQWLISEGEHPSFASVIVRKVLKTKGW